MLLSSSGSASVSMMTTALSASRHCFIELGEASLARIASRTCAATWVVDRSNKTEVSATASETGSKEDAWGLFVDSGNFGLRGDKGTQLDIA